MFTFTVCSRVVHPTLLNGFISSLKAFREQNPDWKYELTRHDNAHLTLLDYSAYDTLTDISAAEYESLCRPGEGTALVWTDPTPVDKFCPHDEACSKASGLTPPR